MRFRVLMLVLFIISYKYGMAQVNPNPGNTFPTVVPPSPELSSLANMGTLSAQNHTGAATMQIPLYELKVGSIALPISLNYSTNGIKINDVPSRVGLGWNLVAGGNISRIIHDEDDETSTWLSPIASFDPVMMQDALEEYLWDATGPNHKDTEKDEYSYSVNGMSGKFYLDDNGLAHCETQSDIQIIKTGNLFILTTGTGVQYIFGGESNLEETKDVKINGTNKIPPISTTGWFLSKITTPDRDAIYFEYGSINVKYYLGKSQMAMFAPRQPFYQQLAGINCDVCKNDKGVIYPVTNNWIEYDTKFLTHISCSNGLSVGFQYESRDDESEDNRLVSMGVGHIIPDCLSTAIKNFGFEYDSYPIANNNQTRFYLKKIKSFGKDEPALVHQFEYDDPAGLPSEKSVGDYFGYNNAGGNGSGGGGNNIFPIIPDHEAYDKADQGTDRSPHFNSAKKGTLKKVIYPTGGYKEFVYEPHTLKQLHVDNVYSHINMEQVGAGVTDTISTIQNFFTLSPFGEDIQIDYQTMVNPEWYFADPQPTFWNPGPNDNKRLSYFYILDEYYNVIALYTRSHDHSPQASSITFHANYNMHYKIRLTVRSLSYRSEVHFQYNPQNTSSYVNVAGCGVRVKQINSFDPVSNKTVSQCYTYGSLVAAATALGKELIGYDDPINIENASQNTIVSSGKGALAASNRSPYIHGGFCQVITGPNAPDHQVIELCPNFIQVSSSSISGSYSFGGSPIAYEYVIESDDPNLIHGGTEHYYSTQYEPDNLLRLLNNPIPSNLGFGNDMNGKELKTRVFKAAANKFIVLSEEESVYGGDSRTYSSVSNLVIRKRFERPAVAMSLDAFISDEDHVSMYDVGAYLMASTWHHLDSKITKTYDENGANRMVNTVSYEYDNTINLQPTAVTTTNSKGETVRQVLQYPNDFGESPYTDMVTNHIISPVIQEQEFLHTDLLTTVNNDYAIWTTKYLIKPSSVRTAKGTAPLETGLQYNAYDINGNVLDMVTQSGINRVYFWNYKSSFPVAEINKASLTTTAYTSFEADDNGGWDFNRAGISDGGITGHKSYRGELQKEVSGASNYIVTLWVNGSALVNGATGRFIKAKGVWSLYQWALSDVGEIRIIGDYIDEVRLIPAGATITTYTYEPFIGISSVCDNNNNITYYQYDGFNRLVVVRDIDNNILKQYDYRYGQTITPCTNTTANWVATGNTRCVGSEPNNNYWTHEKERELVDENNCSPTYRTTIWQVSTTPDPDHCPIVPNCTGPLNKVINGVCEEAVKTLLTTSCSGDSCTCTFIYKWSDGSHLTPFNETNTPGCTQTDD